MPTIFQDSAIHLIPVYLIEKLDFQTDVFISTMALSESTYIMQKTLIDINFFGAKICYLTGQINGWGCAHNFLSEHILINAIRDKYDNFICHPFHFMLNKLESYEIIAYKNYS